MDMAEDDERIEIRRVQALTGERSLTLVLPKAFAIRLGIGKGALLKCYTQGDCMIVQKADLSKE
jgi:hypothetical protein